MFVCPFTGDTNNLVPSRRLLKNGKRITLWVHPDFVNERYIPTTTK